MFKALISILVLWANTQVTVARSPVLKLPWKTYTATSVTPTASGDPGVLLPNLLRDDRHVC